MCTAKNSNQIKKAGRHADNTEKVPCAHVCTKELSPCMRAHTKQSWCTDVHNCAHPKRALNGNVRYIAREMEEKRRVHICAQSKTGTGAENTAKASKPTVCTQVHIPNGGKQTKQEPNRPGRERWVCTRPNTHAQLAVGKRNQKQPIRGCAHVCTKLTNQKDINA